MNATVSATPSPQVVFTWDTQATGVNMGIYRRVMGVTGGTNTWESRGSVAYPTATFTDSIVDGTVYEYKIDRPTLVSPALNEAASFISVTLDAPIVHNRGTLLLFVDNTFSTSLATELTQLEMDLAGDGWTVQRTDFPRDGVVASGTMVVSGNAPALKAAVQAAYNADPTNVKALYLFGRLPIAKSGDQAPDGHTARAEATDGFYGDMTGTWTDTTNYGTGINVPGDGIYDQSYYPAPVTLMVGRVDMAGMTAYPKEELELLRDYLHKEHAFRTGQRTEVSRTGLWNSGYLWEEENWFNPFIGTANMTYAPFKPTLSTTPYLFAMDFGNYDGTSTDYTATPNKLIFGVNFGSYKQDFDSNNNTMRALLAQPDWGLTCAWGGRPAWFFHHMAAGLPIGYSALRTMNNNYTLAGYNNANFDYYPNGDYNWLAGYITVNLEGDPTLRLDPVVPPGNVVVTSTGALTWTASTDGSVSGYHVYRSSNQFGPYTCLTSGTLVTGTTYQDASVPAGDVYYQVRSVKTETHTSTSYANTSVGAFVKLNASRIPNHIPTATGTSISVSANQLTEVVLTGSDVDGNPITPIVLTNPTHGKLRWNGYQILYMPADGYTGSDSIRFVMTDGVAQSSPATINITVNTGNLLEWRFGTPAATVSQNMVSTLAGTGILSSTLTLGSAISQTISTGFQDDSLCLSGIPFGSLNPNGYVQWTVAPATYYKMSLDRVSLGIWEWQSNEAITSELRWSDDGFVTSHTVLIGSSNQMTHPGSNSLAINVGRPYSGNLSGFSALQGRTTPVVFRLYFWYLTQKYLTCGLGKLGTTGTAAITWPSLVVSGSAVTTLTDTPSITSALAVSGTDGIPFSYTVTANNGATNFMASGLPPGLTLNGTTGVISGTITASGTSNVLLSASNVLGIGGTSTVIFSITDLALPSVTSPGVALGGAGNTFSYTIGSTNYPTSFSAIGLPAGLSLNATTGVISGTLPAIGTYGVTIGATNFTGSTTTNLTITVGIPYFWNNFAGNPGVTGSLNGTGSNALFNTPYGVALDGGSNVYIADTNNSTIRKISVSGSVSTLAGTPGLTGSTNGIGSVALFNNPIGVAVDSGSNVYVADTANSTIRKISVSGSVSTLAGTPGVTGTTDASGTAALFNHPTCVAVDSGSNVYVADTANSTIRKISVSGSVSTLAGYAGVSGTTDGLGSAALFNNPKSIAVDSGSNVYVADSANSTIRKITPGGSVLTLAGSPGVVGTTDGPGVVALFSHPYGVAVDSGTNLYVTDGANTVRKVALVSGTWMVTTIGGTPNVTGSASGLGSAALFNSPGNLAVNGSGSIFVADCLNNRISVGALLLSPVITSATVITGTNYMPFSYTIGLNTMATGFGVSALPPGLSLNAATGVISGTPSSTGTMSVILSATNMLGTGTATATIGIVSLPLPVFTSAGGVLGVAGNPFSYTITAINTVTSFFASGFPAGLSLNPSTGVISGTLSAAGNYTMTLGAINLAGTTTTTLNLTVPPYYVWSNFVGTPAVTGTVNGLNALFNAPNGLAMDSGSNIYVADTTNQSIRKITPSGAVSLLAGTPGTHGTTNGQGSSALFYTPYGVAVDSGSNVYVADTSNNAIRMITPSGLVSTLAGTAGGAHGTSDAQGSSASFYYPYGVAVDSGSNVYVADTYNNTIRKISVSGSVSTLAGTPGISGTLDGSGTSAQFNKPEGVAVDSASNIYVADTFNNTIRMITSGGTVITLAGTPGASGTGSSDGVGSVARFNRPMSIAVDSGTNLYIGDHSNQTIRKMVLVNGIWNVTTIGGTSSVTGTVGGLGSASRFNGPSGVGVNSNGNLFVADASNDRIAIGSLSIPVISSGLSMSGSIGVGLNYTITASNSPASYYATGLPSWLSLNTSTGVISGTPTTSGTFVATIGAGNQSGLGTAPWTLTILPTASAYQLWQSLVFTTPQLSYPTISGDTANPTGDGISNLLKYALHLDPFVNGTSGLPVRSIVNMSGTNYLTLTYTKVIAATDLTYTVQVSTDLQTWNSGPSYTTTLNITPNLDGVTQTITEQSLVPLSGVSKQFIRLEVTH